MSTRLTGKTAIVTGGNSGIGQASALALAEAGATVIVTGRRADAVSATEQLHPGIHGIVADVRSMSDAQRVVARALELGGGIDILVNNAGIVKFAPLSAYDEESAQDMFGINVIGLANVTHTALQPLTERKGIILNIGSAAGHTPAPMVAIYGASKAAVESLTRSWAKELAETGVRVNCIAPGPVETPIFGKAGLDPDQAGAVVEKMEASIPLGRFGQADEIARWVVHFADPAADWVTGQVLSIDGGSSIR